MDYQFKKIESEWQKFWAENQTFKVENHSPKPKYYVMDMFPYPSGAGLHVGHPLGYIASDIFARYKRLKGFNVLHPMGYDSFGLPAEQYAIQTGQHPAITTEQNIATYRRQLDQIGFSFDWSREVRTSSPDYYKWTQWIFMQLFNSWYNLETDKAEPISTLIQKFEAEGNHAVKAVSDEDVITFSAEDWATFSDIEKQEQLLKYRLTYLRESTVNWCAALGTVLANDEVKDGFSERGGYPVEQKKMMQWSMRITAYAERLLQGLDTIDWPEPLKEMQRNWIGKSVGAMVRFGFEQDNSTSLTLNPSPGERDLSGTTDITSSTSAANSLSFGEGRGEAGDRPGYATADPKLWETLKANSRENRQNQTEAEDLLWQHLRNNQTSYKIRRQHAIDGYIADFICLKKGLVIEVDGGYHLETQDQDEIRTQVLNELGFEVIRFTNDEVITDINRVVKKIKAKLDSQPERLTLNPSPKKRDLNAGAATSLSPGEGRGEALTTSGITPPFLEVFTTRVDTTFGVTFVVLAPEHELVKDLTTPDQQADIDAYIDQAKKKSELDRMADTKTVSGAFTGSYVLNPLDGNKIPVWIADYVLAGYGTGAVMGVPSGDARDHRFATHFNLPIVAILDTQKDVVKEADATKEGRYINSGFINGMTYKEATAAVICKLEELGAGKAKINYRQRDAIFGRQRYWGEPVPVYFKDGLPQLIDENELPLVLPEVDKYLPTESGEPPLARAEGWSYKPKSLTLNPSPGERDLSGTTDIASSTSAADSLSPGEGRGEAQNAASYPYELSTMPGWAGSSWYWYRYMDAQNNQEFASKEAIDYWKDVDLYIGGSEHATGHLLYSRFWNKFLKDLGLVEAEEPFKKLINQGMIQGVSEFVYQIIGTAIIVSLRQRNQLVHSPNPGIIRSIANDINTQFGRNIIDENGDINELGSSIFGFTSERKNLRTVYGLHVNVMKVNANHELDFATYSKDFEISNGKKPFIYLENGKYLCGHEVEKMSKSKFNVVNPDEMIERYGADTLRMYEMFLGPLEQSKPWNTNGIEGVFKFLRKFWKLFHDDNFNFRVINEAPTKAELKSLHKIIKKVEDDVERFSFNTSVSSFMIAVNELTELKCAKRSILQDMVIILSPYAPHICEELWMLLGNEAGKLSYAEFPKFNAEYLVEDAFLYPISINGKTKTNLNIPLSLDQKEVEAMVLADESVQKYLAGQQPKKVIVVKGRIVNMVV